MVICGILLISQVLTAVPVIDVVRALTKTSTYERFVGDANNTMAEKTEEQTRDVEVPFSGHGSVDYRLDVNQAHEITVKEKITILEGVTAQFTLSKISDTKVSVTIATHNDVTKTDTDKNQVNHPVILTSPLFTFADAEQTQKPIATKDGLTAGDDGFIDTSDNSGWENLDKTVKEVFYQNGNPFTKESFNYEYTKYMPVYETDKPLGAYMIPAGDHAIRYVLSVEEAANLGDLPVSGYVLKQAATDGDDSDYTWTAPTKEQLNILNLSTYTYHLSATATTDSWDDVKKTIQATNVNGTWTAGKQTDAIVAPKLSSLDVDVKLAEQKEQEKSKRSNLLRSGTPELLAASTGEQIRIDSIKGGNGEDLWTDGKSNLATAWNSSWIGLTISGTIVNFDSSKTYQVRLGKSDSKIGRAHV
jgi:hypothetical protein